MEKAMHESVNMSSVGFTMHSVGKPELLCDEDPQEVHLLWLERKQEFSPQTPYMLSLVQRMVKKEIKIRRYERRIAFAIDDKLRDLILSVLTGRDLTLTSTPHQSATEMLNWILDPSHEKHADAIQFLELHGHTVPGLRGKAFSEMQDFVRDMERMIARLESDRDGLRRQIDDMRSSRAKSVGADDGLNGEIIPPGEG